jgi:anthranilate phosphoribosyltransferase
MFAPAHHSAMRHAIGPRKEMGVRTLFNILGPMTNPAGVKRSLIGVYDPALCRLVADVLLRLGSEHVMVVHSQDGLDEISTAAPTHVAEGKDGHVREYQIRPEDAGLEQTGLAGFEVLGVDDSLALIRDALSGAAGERAAQARQIVALNAGAAFYVAGLKDSIRAGVSKALDLLESGKPWEKLQELVSHTASL